jgi:hypothetical protein
MKYSGRVLDARLNAVRDAIGPAPTLTIYGGKSILARIKLPVQWLGDAQGGEISSTEPWRGKVFAGGDATRFSIGDRACLLGDVGKELTLKFGPKLVEGTDVIVDKFTLRAGNG